MYGEILVIAYKAHSEMSENRRIANPTIRRRAEFNRSEKDLGHNKIE
jgi:hypothetical protein